VEPGLIYNTKHIR